MDTAPAWERAAEATGATSDYCTSIADSAFCSITSSVNNNVWEYGRRYQVFRYGRYPMPNDEEEINRELLKHFMFKELLGGKLYLAPIGDNPQKILDLGTGSGEWAIEVGDRFPSAKVIGVDLSRIQPTWIPPNVEFFVDDIEDEWIQPSDFDFIHLRVVCSTLRDPLNVLEKAFRNMKPGGWIEIQEFETRVHCDDGTVPPDYPLTKLYEQLETVFKERYECDVHIFRKVPSFLEQLGFANIKQRVFRLPIGDWPKDKHLRAIGAYFREIMKETLPAITASPFPEHGFDRAETSRLLRDIQASFGDRSIHASLPAHFIWAQKPPVC